jgi:hypothetical protein
LVNSIPVDIKSIFKLDCLTLQRASLYRINFVLAKHMAYVSSFGLANEHSNNSDVNKICKKLLNLIIKPEKSFINEFKELLQNKGIKNSKLMKNLWNITKKHLF